MSLGLNIGAKYLHEVNAPRPHDAVLTIIIVLTCTGLRRQYVHTLYAAPKASGHETS